MSKQNSLCFPCLEKVRTKFPVFPVPWPPCKLFRLQRPLYWPDSHLKAVAWCEYILRLLDKLTFIIKCTRSPGKTWLTSSTWRSIHTDCRWLDLPCICLKNEKDHISVFVFLLARHPCLLQFNIYFVDMYYWCPWCYFGLWRLSCCLQTFLSGLCSAYYEWKIQSRLLVLTELFNIVFNDRCKEMCP